MHVSGNSMSGSKMKNMNTITLTWIWNEGSENITSTKAHHKQA